MTVVANFTYCISSGSPSSAPYTVLFTDASDGAPDTWFWSFGDGFFSDSQNPAHTYETAGPHTVTLKVLKGAVISDIYPSQSNNVRRFGGIAGTRAASYNYWLGLPWIPVTNRLGFIASLSTGIWVFNGAKLTFTWNLISEPTSNAFYAFYTHPFPGAIPPNAAESGLKLVSDAGTYKIAAPVSSLFGDITSRAGTIFTTDALDMNDWAMLIGSPPSYAQTGWRLLSNSIPVVIKKHLTSDTASISKPIVVLKAKFTAVPTTGPNPMMVNFEDKSNGSPVYWSWLKRKGGTSDAWVEFSTEQNPSHLFDKNSP